ncbi:MAG: hypothetical protein A2W99_05325 [Bacteroidetes bacterium GWF2_33_16]|nr:MAG: hypothetical protein A2X00_17845 [Bacteroidetes bacterium GWE2_32_14]OFY06083.1 MAG: hypothetical protein A2W99_05325 [Bacteroidetes bacterium GWF2_33_16]
MLKKELIVFLFFCAIKTSIIAQTNCLVQFKDYIETSNTYSIYICDKPNIPLFNLPVDSVLEFEIKTDFERIFSTEKDEQSRIPGTLCYTVNQKKVELPISIKARGRTRFAFCMYKPLEIKFDKPVYSTIFNGINDEISIITHCGEKNSKQWIFKATESEYKNKLLGEYYLYSILETLGTITRSVSLCKIKYININDSILTENFAFVLEPDENVANRCNLVLNKKNIHLLDESSIKNTILINYFITNYDWELEYFDSTGWLGSNLKILKSEKGAGYLLPYDFDLNAILYPEYWKNKGESFDEYCYRFQGVLSDLFYDKKNQESVYQIYIKIPEIRAILENSYLDIEYKERFIYWIDSFEFILYSHLSRFNKYRRLLK